jgi:hypothetical protein
MSLLVLASVGCGGPRPAVQSDSVDRVTGNDPDRPVDRDVSRRVVRSVSAVDPGTTVVLELEGGEIVLGNLGRVTAQTIAVQQENNKRWVEVRTIIRVLVPIDASREAQDWRQVYP